MSAGHPEALRLADENEVCAKTWIDGSAPNVFRMESASELRRLHAINTELLEALKEMVAGDAEAILQAELLGVPFPDDMLVSYKKASAAIAKATGATP